MNPLRQLKISLLVLLLLVTSGTAGYMIIEGWRFLDAFYMTIITIGTVGFQEVHPLSDSGKIFTILLIIFGVSVLGYAVSKLVQTMFEGQFQRFLGRKKVEKSIDKLRDHYIVCGYGRIGSLICREFAAKPIPFVVVENSLAVLERLEEDKVLFLRGNATEDETLLRAGIKRAKGLVSVVTSDTENVYITLTARGLNPELYILARSGESGSDIKLKRAGANKVVSPYHIGGSRMAQAILRPNVVDFIEIATGREHMDLQMEEIFIPETLAFHRPESPGRRPPPRHRRHHRGHQEGKRQDGLQSRIGEPARCAGHAHCARPARVHHDTREPRCVQCPGRRSAEEV